MPQRSWTTTGRRATRAALERLPAPVFDRGRRAHRAWLRARTLSRVTPISRLYGFDRGLPIDRHYVEAFLARHRSAPGYASGAISGRVLEIGGREYVDRFGTVSHEPGPGLVHRVDVLHENPANGAATIVGSLTEPGA